MINALICTVWILSMNDATGELANIDTKAQCVILDVMMAVGSEEDLRHPVYVDCWDDIKWLKPLNWDGKAVVYMEDCE